MSNEMFETVDLDPDTWPMYRTRDAVVRAVQMATPFEIEVPEGIARGNAGDYIVQDAREEQWPMDQAVFDLLFAEEEEAEDGT